MNCNCFDPNKLGSKSMLNQIIFNKKEKSVFNKDPSKANRAARGNLWLCQPFSEMGAGYVLSCIMTRDSKYGGQGKNKERKFTDITGQNLSPPAHRISSGFQIRNYVQNEIHELLPRFESGIPDIPAMFSRGVICYAFCSMTS